MSFFKKVGNVVLVIIGIWACLNMATCTYTVVSGSYDDYLEENARYNK